MKKVALLTVSLVIGMALFPNRASLTEDSSYEYVDDATITRKVAVIIAEDPDAAFFRIDVDTTAGNVVLTGSVNSDVARGRLIGKIKMIKGVKSVRSLLKVKD